MFTTGQDGCLIMYDVKDRDSKGPAVAREQEFLPISKFSDCIMVEKTEIEDLTGQKDTLQQENQAANDSSTSVDNKMGTNQQETEINKLQSDLQNSKSMSKNKLDQLRTTK